MNRLKRFTKGRSIILWYDIVKFEENTVKMHVHNSNLENIWPHFRSDCSASCGGGKRKRERLCKESLFPPKNAQWTKRTIDSYGSLALLPRAQEKTFDTRRVLDPKLCKRGEPTDLGTCNKHTCPGKTGLQCLFLSDL